jgi:N-acetyl-anhydromuramyl-L-alanine amidase AmpD
VSLGAWTRSKVSYHAIVARDGRRTVLADPDERTWHAGVSSWRGKRDLNSWAIGAAFEGDTNKRELGEAEMASMAEYLLPIMQRYDLTLADVTDHRTVSLGRKDDLAAGELARFKDYLPNVLSSDFSTRWPDVSKASTFSIRNPTLRLTRFTQTEAGLVNEPQAKGIPH